MAQPFGLPGWLFADGVHSVMLVRVWKVPGTYSTPPNPEVCFSLMLHRFSYFAASSWSHKFAIVGLSWPKLKVNNPGWYWKKFKAGEGSYISSLFVEARGIFDLICSLTRWWCLSAWWRWLYEWPRKSTASAPIRPQSPFWAQPLRWETLCSKGS